MGVFRKRDLGALCCLFLGIYLSLDRHHLEYEIIPAFYLDQKTEYKVSIGWNPPPPIVADLDGDGYNEIICITPSMHLKIMSADRPSTYGKNEIYTPDTIAKVSLAQLSVQKGKLPVALTSGYVERYSASRSREQVIVVAREDLTISCFNFGLELLWEKAVGHKTNDIGLYIDKFKVREISILLSPLSPDDKQTGMIIVGASMGLRNEDVRTEIEKGLGSKEDGTFGDHPEADVLAKLEHFNFYALNASNGHVIWKHDGMDVRPQQFTRSLPQHMYRLGVRDVSEQIHEAPGIGDWTVFRQSLIEELPHDWHNNGDTSLRLAHFQRQHVGAGSDHQLTHRTGHQGRQSKITRKGGGNSKRSRTSGTRSGGQFLNGGPRFVGVTTEPLSRDAALPHDANEHTSHPNVIVAHTSGGLEVISLQSGVPVSSLALLKGRSYMDLDGDGLVDSVLVLESSEDVEKHGQAFAHEEGELLHCSIMVVSGLPPRSQLFNGSICSSRHSLSNPSRQKKIPHVVFAAPPLVLRKLGSDNIQEASQKDLAVAVNTGSVTLFKTVKGSGGLSWQSDDGPTWELDFKHAAIKSFDADSKRVAEHGTHDTAYSDLLVMGDKSLLLLDREGEQKTKADIPSTPIAQPILADFDNDEISDVIIVTAEAIYGYKIEVKTSTRGLLVAIILLAALAFMIYVTSIRYSVVDDKRSVVGNDTHTAKRKVLSLARSTEEYHLD